jgi:hypothetical protein
VVGLRGPASAAGHITDFEHIGRIANQLLHLLCATASGEYQPRCAAISNSDFQLTRGLLGVSL